MNDVSDDFRVLHQMIAVLCNEHIAWPVKNECDAALWGRLWLELDSRLTRQISALQPGKSVIE